MRNGTNTFRGELPHLAPEALPDQGAQEATNCRLETGNLEAYRQFAQTHVLANTGTVQTIFLAQHPTTDASAWLSFNDVVDIARNVVEDDPDGLLLLTSPGLYDTPVYTTYATATAGAEPYPAAGSLLPLGVPGPSDIPTLALGVDPTPTTFSVDVLDEGDELATSWTVSNPVAGVTEAVESAVVGNPANSYALLANSNAGRPAFAYRDFAMESATLINVEFDWSFHVGAANAQMIANIAVGVGGIGFQVRYDSTLARFSIGLSAGWQSQGYSELVSDAISPLLSHTTWYTTTVVVSVNEDNTQVFTAELLSGATVIASLTLTNVFELGGKIGFVHESSALDSYTFYDNLHVTASGSTGITANITVTNYVYTFVNDRGWESVPSLPTEDVNRADGVSVTVTTSTTAPAGYIAVTHKRIYRLVSALTGDLFLLVAEIPLAQADYVDTLTDNQVGPDVLESQEFDLPPATMQDIIALPCGAYAGFFGKQLCLSAAGWPHAWPVRQRHSCEFPIVGIDKLGNTIVVGTTGRVYTCTGTEPGNYVMSEPGEAQACLSKLGMVFLDGQGVAFPSPDGYVLCQGSAGNLRNLTENVFTKRQWQEKNPASIIGAVHDGVLHWYWETVEPATETVLFLFHMTETGTAEGIAEFIGGPTSALDQTSATWTADTTNWLLPDSSPSPKFGLFSLGSTDDVTWGRDIPQSDPGVPTDYSTVGVSTLQIDGWFYFDTGAVVLNALSELSVGIFNYPLVKQFDLFVNDDGDACARFDDGGTTTDVFGSTGTDFIPSDQWVHIRLLYTGSALVLFVGGVQYGQAALSGAIEQLNPINLMQVRFVNTGIFVDDVRASIGGSASTANFTPPVSPWPNP